MTRIVGGTLGGRRVRTPPGDKTRPTSDRVREALFGAIEARVGTLRGLSFLDLYAGSGAVGLEAFSRGAVHVTWVESDRRTAAVVSGNVRDLDVAPAEVRATAVQTFLSGPPARRFDVVFSDPPYALTDDDLAADLELLVPWLADDALVVVERSRRSPEPRWPSGPAGGIEPARERRYGETVLWYGRAAHDPVDPGEANS